MIFLALVGKNLLRRPTRSLLTIAGIAIGIGAVVALASLAWGFEKSWERAYAVRGTDLVVTKVTSQSPLAAPFDGGIKDQLLRLPHIEKATGLLSDMVSVEDSPTVLVFGWELQGFLWEHLQLIEGRWPANDSDKCVVIGTLASTVLKKSLGAPIQVETGEFTVCGIFKSGALVENSAIVMALPQLQNIMGNPGRINFLNLRVTPGTTPEQLEQLRQTIKNRMPGFQAFSTDEVARHNTAIQMAKAMSWATSAIALIVGAVGVMNTVLMSVFERIHEIGVLLAIGWRRSRIVRMILYESVVLSFLGGLVGIALGCVAVQLLMASPWMILKIEVELSWHLFSIAFAIALGLGVLGGLYPAFLGSRLHPNEAMRYE